MDYQRIHKPQIGIISPSKLRAKLMGVSHQQRTKEGSNCNSSTTSPSKRQDSEFVKDSLLPSTDPDFDDPVTSVNPIQPSLNSVQICLPRENIDLGHFKVQQTSRIDNGNSSAVHPLKPNEDENLDYDSNASSSSFEFHKGERVGHRSLTRSLSRPTSYKWNDAEKWIVNKQMNQAIYPKGHGGHSTGNRLPEMNMVRVAPELGSYGYRFPGKVSDNKRVDFSQPTAQMKLERFNCDTPGLESLPVQSTGVNVLVDLFPQSKDSGTDHSAQDVTAGMRAISMRDMGTEMTPMTSQEPSRTTTPAGATTPRSLPSTPRGELATTPVDSTADCNSQNWTEKGDKELSEQELKLKTRREIVALGVQLGKMNIAAWASKDDKEKNSSLNGVTNTEEVERIEYEKRAASWEEAEKTKHAARYKREEIKIQAWESQQRAKLEEDLRRIEAKVERLRTISQAKMVKKIATARRISEEKRLAAEAQKKRQAEKTAAQAEYIRQTGRIPSTEFMCCGFFS